MNCLKCEIGTLGKIRFKNTDKAGVLCSYCEALWFEGDEVTPHTAHSLRSYSQGESLEYSFDEENEKDQEHESVEFVKYR